MTSARQLKSALISVFSKDRITEIAALLRSLDIRIFSTGGTYDFLVKAGFEVTAVEEVTSYPSILGGRVKTLHPKVFGGILFRRGHEKDQQEVAHYQIPPVDLVIVDLYPFEKTVATTKDEAEIIEKIDVGGISLIRAAAKNFNDVLIVPSADHYSRLIELLQEKNGVTSLEDRRLFAAEAFHVSSHYDSKIFGYFNRDMIIPAFKESIRENYPLRYGENPHQQGVFFGNLEEIFVQHHGKAISYNNLVDIDAALALIGEFDEPTCVIIKHTNACGVASRPTLLHAWTDALACDPVSAFGGVIVVNRPVDPETAAAMNTLFFEILIAGEYEEKALELLKSKKNRILLQRKNTVFPNRQFKSVLNGAIVQDKDLKTETAADFRTVTKVSPSEEEISDLIFANKIVKHQKSNTIVLVKGKQLSGCGTGQTSRIDALKQAVTKADEFGLSLRGAVMASDAFFPFADSVELADKAGIRAVVQPGGSVRDVDSIAYCDEHGMAMVFTGTRHFKH